MHLTYHDPCYLGRYAGEYDAPRALLRAIGIEPTEMARSRRTARCCGWGGGAALADIPGRRRIPDDRMDDVRATRAASIAVACPNCATMLEGVTGAHPTVKDVAELLAEAIPE
jgi:dimethylglycine catabolism B